jgi:hypothetical protein
MKRPASMKRMETVVVATTLVFALGCQEQSSEYAQVYPIETMSQVIGGPAAAARVGDLVLENERIRAVIHARHNQRGTFPVGNGSLVDLDIQRPFHRFGVGKGHDAFYELAPMVDLKISAANDITHGLCGQVGASSCPERPCSEIGCGGQTGKDERCARVSVKGRADNIIGIFGLLDLAISRPYQTTKLEIVNDYDLCPGETIIRITTRARFYGATDDVLQMDELQKTTSLFDAMLGPHSGIDCSRGACPAETPHCDDVLANFNFGSISTEMKRCRSDAHDVGGVIGGDLTLFSAKARVFIPQDGFDQETYIRSIFDTGGDVFSNPLSLDYMAALTDDVSYAYFNASGKVMVPIFAESFTAAITNSVGCPRGNRECFKNKELEFRRYVSVGDGSVASALAPYYKLRGTKTGALSGHVVDARTRRPVSKIDVLVIGVPQAWQSLSAAELSQKSYDELTEQNRKESKTSIAPLGQVGVVSHFLTDAGLDTRSDGSFAGQLPVGRYLLVARRDGGLASSLVPVEIVEGGNAKTMIELPQSGRLEFTVRDNTGRELPSKITVGVCMPECARDADCKNSARPRCRDSICVAETAAEQSDCRPDQRWDKKKASCVCDRRARLPLEMGGRRFSDGVIVTSVSTDGRGQLTLAPGTYEVIASRGIEYDIVRRFVTIKGDTMSRFSATLSKVIDTRGWISGDFHVHGPNSVDSGLDHRTRIRSYVAEGVELVSSSDHDQLTDYQPTILALGVQPWITSQVGLECSPLDYGHYLGFPLAFNENSELNGAFHWREDTGGSNFPDWRNRTPGQIFNLLREHGELDQTIVVIAHFYDAFTFFSLDPFTLDPPALNINALFNKVLGSFSGNFDGLEALSGKNFDVIRRPTWSEIRDYNVKLSQLLARTDLTSEQRQDAWKALSGSSQREFLRRTPDEQTLAIAYDNPDFECRCTQDSECGPTSLCDQRRGACIAACKADSDCDTLLVAATRESCLPFLGRRHAQDLPAFGAELQRRYRVHRYLGLSGHAGKMPARGQRRGQSVPHCLREQRRVQHRRSAATGLRHAGRCLCCRELCDGLRASAVRDRGRHGGRLVSDPQSRYATHDLRQFGQPRHLSHRSRYAAQLHSLVD